MKIVYNIKNMCMYNQYFFKFYFEKIKFKNLKNMYLYMTFLLNKEDIYN